MGIEQNIRVAADTLLIAGGREVLLVKRLYPPFRDMWALPGGFVEDEEDLHEAAARELREETSVEIAPERMVQFRTYGKPGRDPRGRTVSIVYLALVPARVEAVAADDAKEVRWFELSDLPPMAFDHGEVVRDYIAFAGK